jgi:hypothetical protein
MTWLLLALQLSLSGVFLLAATGKVLRSEEFLAALRLSHLPEVFVGVLGVGVPALEYGLVIALLISTPLTLQVALSIAIALLAVFTVWMVWVVARQLHLRCGCFGTGGVEVGLYSIARNSLLLLVATAALVLARQTRSPLPLPSGWLVMTIIALSMGFVLLYALWATRSGLILTLHRLESRLADPQHEA